MGEGWEGEFEDKGVCAAGDARVEGVAVGVRCFLGWFGGISVF